MYSAQGFQLSGAVKDGAGEQRRENKGYLMGKAGPLRNGQRPGTLDWERLELGVELTRFINISNLRRVVVLNCNLKH